MSIILFQAQRACIPGGDSRLNHAAFSSQPSKRSLHWRGSASFTNASGCGSRSDTSKLFYHLGINWFNFVNLLLGPDKLSGSSRQPPNQQPCYLHSVQHSPKKSTVIQQQLPPASQSPPFFIPHRYFFPRKWWVKCSFWESENYSDFRISKCNFYAGSTKLITCQEPVNKK